MFQISARQFDVFHTAAILLRLVESVSDVFQTFVRLFRVFRFVSDVSDLLRVAPDLLVLFQTFQTVVRLRTSLADLCPHVYTFSHLCPSFQPFLISAGHFHTFARLLVDFSKIFKLLQVLVHDLVSLLEPQTFV